MKINLFFLLVATVTLSVLCTPANWATSACG